MAQQWYIVHAYSNYEKVVARSIKERVAVHNMEDSFGQVLVPSEEVIEIKVDGKQRISERKFFPGYVFVEMEMNDDTWHLIKDVPKVLGFIGGTPENPAPISEAEVNKVLNRITEGAESPRPKTLFDVGEVIRVIDGPFVDFDGMVESVNYDKNKLTVSVSIFGRSTPEN